VVNVERRETKNENLTFTCDWCHETGSCSKCVLTCSTCKATMSRGLKGMARIRSTAQIESVQSEYLPNQEHYYSCGRRKNCQSYC
jgi:hypothetical protein